MSQQQTPTGLWFKLQYQFDAITKNGDHNELFQYLRNLVDVLSICRDSQCPIFHNLYLMDLKRIDFHYDSIAEAQEKERDMLRLRAETKRWFEFLRFAKKCLAEIFAIYQKEHTTRQDQIHQEEYYVKVLETMAENNMQVPMEMSKGMEAQLNAIGAATLNPRDPKVQKLAEANREIVHPAKKTEKKGKKKENVKNG